MVLSTMDTWILLRGLTREAAHWGRFADDFRRAWPGAQVVTLDLPGNGQFHALPSPPSVPDMVAACRAELARQGVRPPFRLFAMSLGAMVATQWARSAPQDIGGCVLVNTSFRPFSPFFHRLRPHNYAALLGLALLPRSAGHIERTVWRLTSNAPEPPTAVIDAWVADTGCRAPHPHILLLASQNDRLVNSRCSLAIARGWQCDLELHPQAGHDLPLDAPGWVLEQVQQWLCRVAAAQHG